MTGVPNTFDTTGKAPYDFESTAMVLQALAPYYTGSKTVSDSAVTAEITTKVNGCVDSIKQLQTTTGGISYAFFNYDADWNANFAKYADSSDAMSQIILAFTALGIDIDTVSNGGDSMLDNFLSVEYQTGTAGEFRSNADPLTAYYSTYYSTKYAYMALVAYSEMANSGAAFSLFDRATPVAYTDYDYSFFYPASTPDTEGPEAEKPAVKDPVKTGDAFPAAGAALVLIFCGASLFWLKKAKAGR